MVEIQEYNEQGLSPELRQPGEISQGGVVDTASAPTSKNKVVTIEPIVLSTKRLTLRAPHKRDFDAIVNYANNANVAKNLGQMPHPYTHTDAAHWADVLAQPSIKKQTFAITDRFEDKFLGGCGYRPDEMDEQRVIVGYWLGEPFWGSGIAAEATQAIIDHAFRNEEITSVVATARTSNHQSKRVLEKCGFQFTHNGMALSLAVNGMVAIEHYRLCKRTWESLHAWGER
ncbi:MAG: GNAT family protein [Hyphomicrobiales bacterium]